MNGIVVFEQLYRLNAEESKAFCSVSNVSYNVLSNP